MYVSKLDKYLCGNYLFLPYCVLSVNPSPIGWELVTGLEELVMGLELVM